MNLLESFRENWLGFQFSTIVCYSGSVANGTCLLPPNPLTGGGTGEKALSRCKGGPERALSVVKGLIGWRKGRIRLRKGPMHGN